MNNKGFTLVETVVSIAILAIMSTMAAGIFSSASAKTAENMRDNIEKERVLAQIETAIADGDDTASPELERRSGNIVIDFGGNKINAGGVFLSGEYGDKKLPVRYFYVER